MPVPCAIQKRSVTMTLKHPRPPNFGDQPSDQEEGALCGQLQAAVFILVRGASCAFAACKLIGVTRSKWLGPGQSPAMADASAAQATCPNRHTKTS
jgi:hypothetical protein